MPIEWAATTHPGQLRSNNEDAIYCDENTGLWILADGMGGHQAGDVASAMTIDAVSQSLTQNMNLHDAISHAHKTLLKHAEENPSTQGMGSTVVCLHNLGADYNLAWVGDSRAYRWHQGKLNQLSRDHSYVQSLIETGQLSEEDARRHPEKNVITQCLGAIDHATINPEQRKVNWQDGETVILCSDGLNDELADVEIAQILGANNDTEAQVKNLQAAALANGGRDNISIIAIQYTASKINPDGDLAKAAGSALQGSEPEPEANYSNDSHLESHALNETGFSLIKKLTFAALLLGLLLIIAFNS